MRRETAPTRALRRAPRAVRERHASRRVMSSGADARARVAGGEDARAGGSLAPGTDPRAGGFPRDASDSAGSGQESGTEGEKRVMTARERAERAIERAKAAAKAGIVSVPRGSATKARHGLAVSKEELAAKERRLNEEKLALEKNDLVQALTKRALSKKKSMFSVKNLDHFLTKPDSEKDDDDDKGYGDEETDEDDEIAQAAKYAEDDDEERSFLVLHPTNKVRRYWDFVQIFLLAYIALSVPYRVGFSEPAYGIWYVADFCIDMYFYVDVLLNFFTAYWETSTDDDDFHYVTNLWKIQKHYLKGWFVPDAISLIPIEYIARTVDGTSACSWESEAACGIAAQVTRVPEALRLLKLLRLLRVVRTKLILARYQETLMRVYKVVTIVRLIALLLLVSHFTACMYAYVYEFEREDRSGQTGRKFDMYVAALFWSVQTLTTVGYGNVVPTTVSERIVAILVMITGGFVFSAIISGVNMSMDEDSPGNRFAVLMNHVRELLAEHKMPGGLKSRVRSHYRGSNKPAKLVNRDIIQPLPDAIRADVNFYIYGKALAIGLKAAGTVEPNAIIVEIVCRTMDTRTFSRGARVCYPYELASNLMIVLTGRVSYSADEITGFLHSEVMKIKRKRLRNQQIALAEEKGVLRSSGTVINPGLLTGFFKGIACVICFDKYVECLILDHGAFYDMCSQHQPALLRNFEDEFLQALEDLGKPKMSRIALSESNMRRFIEETTRNVCSNWREILAKERAAEDEKREEREKAGGAVGVVSKQDKSSALSNSQSNAGATIGAIKLSMQQMHADIVNVSEQVAEVMVQVKAALATSQDTAVNVSKLGLVADTIEAKTLSIEMNLDATFQAMQGVSDAIASGAGAGGVFPMGSQQVFDFTSQQRGGGIRPSGGAGVSPGDLTALEDDRIRQRIEEAARKGTKLVVTRNVVTQDESWDSRRPQMGVQGIRRTAGFVEGPTSPPTTDSRKWRADKVLDDTL